MINKIINKVINDYSIKSYSQEGEDMILWKLFKHKANGFYVDVGAHHPKRFSNTYHFYKNGWCGINIDAMPGSMKQFKKMRPLDINVEVPISDKEEKLTYYAFNEPALNGFSKELSNERDGKGGHFIKFTKEIITSTVKNVLDKHMPKNQEIDFLSIDVEGMDFKVLKSNDFEKYKPSVILIEVLNSNIFEIKNSNIAKYLEKYGYTIYSKTMNTVIFMSNDFYDNLFE